MTIIPAEALKNHIGIVAKAGAGKTYAAKGIVEGLLDAGERVCIVDPTGVWNGLRSKANGKSGAYPVVIFGGEHADLPLGQVHGEAIAEIVATSNTPAIIDTSLMKVGERTRFFTDFASELLRKNRGPLHLFIDECHLFMPQGRVADPQSGNMLHAANNLISLGRAKGLRVTLISQRPAKIHKDSLSQIETLIALRLIAPQDRHAIEDWIADQADEQKGKDIIASLPSLSTGQGWVWAPELGILKKVTFPKIKTFDSSSTPDGAGDGRGPVLAAIDMATISSKLVAIKEEAEANDPAKLRLKIRELEKRITAAPAANSDDKAIERARQSGLTAGYDLAIADFAGAFPSAMADLAALVSKTIASTRIPGPKTRTKATASIPRTAAPPMAVAEHRRKLPPKSIPAVSLASPGALTTPQQRIVDALAFWAAAGTPAPLRQQVAAVAGYKPGSGNFNNLLGQLASAAIISYPRPGLVTLTQSEIARPIDHSEAKQRLLSTMSGSQLKVLNAFNGTEAAREEIAERSGYAASSGNFNNLLGSLSSIGVVTRPAPGVVDLTDWVRELL
jgi:hypothetical protein